MHKCISSCTSHISWEFSGLTSPAMGDFSDLLCTATQRSLQKKMTYSIPSRQMPKHHTHTHKTKAKITLHQFFLSFLLYLYDSIKFLHKLQKDWKFMSKYLKSSSRLLIWEIKKLDRFVFETEQKADHNLNFFLFSTFSKSFISLLIADSSLFITLSASKTESVCPLTAILPKSISGNSSVILWTSCY